MNRTHVLTLLVSTVFLVACESDDLVVMASEEVAIRQVLPQEIDTIDPYDREVRVWQN